MKNLNKLIILITIPVIFFSRCSQSESLKPKVIPCESDVTLYYPLNYNQDAHTPSFTIVNELIDISAKIRNIFIIILIFEI